ncbi:MAG: BspA family leucine-rich repeat surface protein, partial [Clostridia bacterium]|nr:BspA family leucine-rich repeat surface protein [Clostridia bacterium]
MKFVRMLKKMSKPAMLAMLGLMLTLSAGFATEQTQLPTNELDGTKIENVKVAWVTGDSAYLTDGTPTPQAELDAKDHLYLSATSQDALSMVYRITADFSGQHDYAPGDITITIPGKVWHGRKYVEESGQNVGVADADKLLGKIETPLPPAPSTKADFNWQIINGEYVLTNTRTISAASSISLDVRICGVHPVDVVDVCESDPITARVEVITAEGNTVEQISNSITAQIDTSAKLTYVYNYGEVYEELPDLSDKQLSSLPAGTEPEDYVYVRWNSYPQVSSTQAYSLVFEEFIGLAYEKVYDGNGGETKQEVAGGIFLGSTNERGSMPGSNGADYSVVAKENGTATGSLYSDTVSVWTAYPKSEFKNKHTYYFESKAVWTLTEADAAVPEDIYDKDADERRATTVNANSVVTYTPRGYERSWGSFGLAKFEDENSYALNQLLKREDIALTYTVEAATHGHPWTSEVTKGISYDKLISRDFIEGLDDQELMEAQFGKLAWKQVVTDDQLFFNYEKEQLTAEDFEFSSLRLSAPSRYRFAKQSDGTWNYQLDSSLPIPDMLIEYQVNGDETWLPAATAVWGEDGRGGLVFKYVGESVTVSGMTLNFPANTTDFRYSYTSNVFNGKTAETCELAAVSWRVYPSVVLKASDRVYGIVQKLMADNENAATVLSNHATSENYGWVNTDGEGTFIIRQSRRANGKLGSAHYGVSLKKTATYENDPENQQVVLHYNVSLAEKSNLASRSDYQAAVEEGIIFAETSGIWYDLLPPHVTPLLDTVALRSGDTVTGVYTIENYKDTGRTLLVVEAALKPSIGFVSGVCADQPQMRFDALYNWQDMDLYGDRLENYVVFQSTTENLPDGTLGNAAGRKGEPDDPAGGNNNTTPYMPAEILNALKELDPNTDENRFVYGKNSTRINVLTYAVSGMEKTVKSDLDGVWTHGLLGQEAASVYEGQTYTYRLRVSSAEGTSTKNIILYDSIENYMVSNSDAESVDYAHIQARKNWSGAWENKGQWKGTLEKVDLSEFAAAGAAPVLLYATQEVQFSNDVNDANYDITNRDLWQIADLDENGIWNVPAGTNVMAIAVDVTKRGDGTDFVLVPEKALSVYLKMRAPDDQGDENVWNAKGAYARDLNAADSGVIDWEAAQDPANNMYAYNNAYARLMQGRTNEINGTTSWVDSWRLIRNDYTRVGIKPQVVSLEKVWQDQENHDGMRPESVRVSVLRRAAGTGNSAEPVLDAQQQPLTVELNEANGWKAEFHQLPIMDRDGRLYFYTFEEEPVEGYETRVIYVDASHYELVNIHPNEQVSIQGVKIWTDENDVHGARPEAITLKLYRDGEQIDSRIVRPGGDGEWKYSFGQRDKYAAGGKEYTYTIEEEYVPKYAPDMEDFAQLNNTYIPVGTLEVSKTLLNDTTEAAKQQFPFTLVLLAEQTDENASVMPLTEKYPYTIYEKDGETWKQVESGTVGNGDTFYLKKDQKIAVENIPSESIYMVMEGETAGFVVSEAENTEGMIKAGQTNNASFINEYHATGTVQLSVSKKLTGNTIQRNQFRFELVDMTEGSETYGQVIRTARVNEPEDGATTGGSGEKEIESLTDAVFGQLEYTDADNGKTFKYQVREVDKGMAGYKSDEKVYDVTVTVADNGDGTLTVTPEFADAAGTAGELKFENKYEASGELVLKAWKSLEGRALQENEFTFELYRCDAQGNILGEMISDAKNDAEGVIVFEALKFNQSHLSYNKENPAQYTYLIREKQGADETVVYSNLEYIAAVTVMDNGNGTLSFKQSVQQYTREYTPCADCAGMGCDICNNEGVIPGALTIGAENVMPVFANQLKPGSLSVAKQVKGEGSSNPDQTFAFQIKLSNQIENPDYAMAGVVPTATVAPTATPTAVPTATPVPAVTPVPERATPKPVAALNFVQPVVKPVKRGTVDTSKQYHATEEELKGQAYAALNIDADSKTYGKLVFFRSESPIFTDPFGNIFDASALSKANSYVQSEENKTIYYFVDEHGNPVYNNVWAWPWERNMSKVTEIDISQDAIRPVTGREFFYGALNAKSMNLSKLDTSHMTSMESMFERCGSLTSLDVSSFDTSNVTNMSRMFAGYNGGNSSLNVFMQITALDLSSFNTSKVTTMQGMFAQNVKLTSLGISSFDTSSVTNMAGMFADCSAMTTVDVSGFDTSSVTNMSGMFSGKDNGEGRVGTVIVSWTDLDLSNFNTSNVTNMSSMFCNCRSLTSLDISSFDTANVTNMASMFQYCISLPSLDLRNFNTSRVTDMSYMFASYYHSNASYTHPMSLTSLDISSFNTSSVKNMSYMFKNCTKLTRLDVSTFDTGSATNMMQMFAYCFGLNELDLSNFNTTRVTYMSGMFLGCTGLTSLNLCSFDTGKVITMENMFNSCWKLTGLDVSSFDTANVTKMNGMFSGCSCLTDMDLRNFNTGEVTTMQNMFYGCSSLTGINVSSFDTGNVTNMQAMFYNCNKLPGLDLRNFNTSKVTTMQSMFYKCSSMTGINVSSFDTGNVTNMQAMFYDCKKLTSLDVSNFNTAKVTTMQEMFDGCSGLTSLDLSSFRTENLQYMSYLVRNCSNLEFLDISGFDTSKMTGSLYYVYAFYYASKLQTVSINDATKMYHASGSGSYIPTAPSTAPYNGKWVNVIDRDKVYSSKDLFTTGGHGGTWTWDVDSFELIFNPGAGAGAMESAVVTVRSSYTFTPAFYNFGYDLTGFTDDNGKFYAVQNGTVTIPSNNGYKNRQKITLTAQWEKRDISVCEAGDSYAFTLKANESFNLRNLPAGTAYEVWEDTPAGWVLVEKIGDTGEIKPLETSKAVFTNEYNPNKVTADIRAFKLMDGKGAAEGAFSFTLSENSTVLQTKQNTAGGGVVFDLMEYTAAGTHTYTIAEVKDATNTAVNFDDAVYTVVVTVADDNAGNLTATVVYKNGNAELEGIPNFHNATKPGSLTISKKIDGTVPEKAKGQEFDFIVSFTGTDHQFWNGEVTIGTETAAVTNGKVTVKLKDGESVTLTNVPAGVKYEVTETVPAGWTQTEAEGAEGTIAANAE